MFNTAKSVVRLCIGSSLFFIALGIPMAVLNSGNQVAILMPVIFGFCMFLLGLILSNKFEIEELHRKLDKLVF